MTLADVAQAVAGKAEADLSDGERTTLADLSAWCAALVDRYLAGSPIPADVERAATLRLAYYDYHVRLARRPADGGMLDARFRRDAPLAPLRASGAMSLLSPWKRRGVGVAP